MIKEISQKEFTERFPHHIHAYNWNVESFLENGDVLFLEDWNGEFFYTKDENGLEVRYKPVLKEDEDGDYIVEGYEIS